MKYDPMTLERQGASFRIGNSHLLLAGTTLPPELSVGQAGQIDFAQSGTSDTEIAGIAGKVIRETSQSGQVELTREFFLGDDGRYVGLRMTVKNIGSDPIRLTSMTPLRVKGDENFKVAGGALPTWRVLKLSRHKSDMPGVFRPSQIDVDYKDAAFNAANIKAGAGIQGDLDSKFNLKTIFAEPAVFVKNEQRLDDPGVFVCIMGEQKHLTSICISPSQDNKGLSEFSVFCEFDDVVIDPGASRDTHWILMYQRNREAEALASFVGLQASHYNIDRLSAKRMNVFCSWYFYGREFCPEDLDENLKILKDRPMPMDVFIIDNGWNDTFGDWNASDLWPDGMAAAADKIRDAGLIPGIWTAPFVMMPWSKMAKAHPELIAKTPSGDPAMFGYVEGECYVVDTTHPFCKEYFDEYLNRLKGWGFTYHKMDFTRAITIGDLRFQDPHVNRAQAYRLGLELIREALGPDCYFQSCGGLMGSSNFGLADSIRLGADSLGNWEHYSGNRAGGTLVQIKQAMVRNYLCNLIPGDPDSLMLRRREEPFRQHKAAKHNRLSDGKFTDDEAFTLVVRQYLCGGYTDITERLAELPEDRRALLRHMVPAFGPPAKIVDLDRPNCPTLALTDIEPNCQALGSWQTLSVSNWDDTPTVRTLTLLEAGVNGDGEYALFEFARQEFLGTFSADESIELEIPSHGTRVLRIAPFSGKPMIVGMDLHLSGGGAELADIQISDDSITGRVVTDWDYPVNVTAVFPGSDGLSVVTTTVAIGDSEFTLKAGN